MKKLPFFLILLLTINIHAEESNELDMNTALFSKIIQFRYNPSERDPFVSFEVISPFVTESDLPPQPDVDAEKVAAAKNAIDGIVKDKIKITGISTGRIGVGYAISQTGQIVRPGEYILVPLEEKDQQEIDTAAATAAAAGVVLGIETYKGALLVETRKIEERSVKFKSPVKMPGEKPSEFTVEYKKEVGFEQLPSPSEIQPEEKQKSPDDASKQAQNPAEKH